MHRGLKVKPILGLQSIIKINIVKKTESTLVNLNTAYYILEQKKSLKLSIQNSLYFCARNVRNLNFFDLIILESMLLGPFMPHWLRFAVYVAQ